MRNKFRRRIELDYFILVKIDLRNIKLKLATKVHNRLFNIAYDRIFYKIKKLFNLKMSNGM